MEDFQHQFPALGLYNGVGGTRQRGYRSKWPAAYGKMQAQTGANKLCTDIVSHLCEIPEEDKQWSMRDVEAVLFMEGY